MKSSASSEGPEYHQEVNYFECKSAQWTELASLVCSGQPESIGNHMLRVPHVTVANSGRVSSADVVTSQSGCVMVVAEVVAAADAGGDVAKRGQPSEHWVDGNDEGCGDTQVLPCAGW